MVDDSTGESSVRRLGIHLDIYISTYLSLYLSTCTLSPNKVNETD